MSAGNHAGVAAVDEMIARLRGFPDAIRAEAPAIAKRVQAAVEEDIAAGRAPTGTPWKPKKGGGRALVHAAKALTVKAIGTVILLTLEGPEVFHNFGTHKVPARPILPSSSSVPLKLGQAIRLGVVEAFRKKVARG